MIVDRWRLMLRVFCCAEADEIHEEMLEGKLTLFVLLMSDSTMPLSRYIFNKLNLVNVFK